MKKLVSIDNYYRVLIVFLLLSYSASSRAYQPDAPHQKAMQENAKTWQKEDNAINARLADLKKRFGKKPNIIYILGDDIGWGELGSYLGGKLRGTPTPNLDRMAKEGMQFLSHPLHVRVPPAAIYTIDYA